MSEVYGRSGRPVLYGVLGLAAISGLGGVISVAGGLSPTLLDAMGPAGRLSVPIPMIAAQFVLAAAASTRRRVLALVGSGLLAASLLVGAVSGFFDGGYADGQLTGWHRAYQAVLVATLLLVAVTAALRFVHCVRHARLA